MGIYKGYSARSIFYCIFCQGISPIGFLQDDFCGEVKDEVIDRQEPTLNHSLV